MEFTKEAIEGMTVREIRESRRELQGRQMRRVEKTEKVRAVRQIADLQQRVEFAEMNGHGFYTPDEAESVEEIERLRAEQEKVAAEFGIAV